VYVLINSLKPNDKKGHC